MTRMTTVIFFLVGVKGNINELSVDRPGIFSSPYRIIIAKINFPRASIDTLLVYQ